MEPLEPGDPERIGGFVLTGRLGAGGMGQVYLARTPTGRPVAVKVVHRHLAAHPGFKARFALEVRAAALVSGPYTAEVVAADPTAEAPWMATEFVPGPTLADALRERGTLPPDEVWELAAGMGRALVAIHAARVVHRDLKPSNVVLSAEGPRVIDFGIARASDVTGLTGTGTFVGTAGFMSPEHIAGAEVDGSADVFSLGAVLCCAATGRSPYGEDTPMVLMYRIVHAEPDLGGLTDPGLRDLVAACLARDPRSRPTPQQVVERALAARGGGRGPDPVAPTLAPSTVPSSTEAVAVALDLDPFRVRGGPETVGGRVGPRRRAVLAVGAAAGLGIVGTAAGRFWPRSSGGSGTPKPSGTTSGALTLDRVVDVGSRPSRSLAWAPTGRTLAVGGAAGPVVLWDLSGSAPSLGPTMTGLAAEVVGLAFGPGGLLAGAGADGTLVVWDTVTGRPRATRTLPSGTQTSTLRFAASGDRLIAGGTRWSAPGWTEQPGLTLSPATVLADGGRATLSAEGAAVTVADVGTGALRRTVRATSSPVLYLDVAGDGVTFVCATESGQVWFGDAATGATRVADRRHAAAALGATAAPTGGLAATAGQEQTVYVWDVASRSVRYSLAGWVYGLAFSPDGRQLAGLDLNDQARVWFLAT